MLSELAARLNCAEYKNWVKAGHCLLLLRSCLQGFVGREVLSFHRRLLTAVPGLGPNATCRGGSRCNPRARQVSCWPRAGTHIPSLSPVSCACLFLLRGGAVHRSQAVPISWILPHLCPLQFQPQCQVCIEWKREILRHHINRNGDVHWGNCRPGLWPVDAWEVAKVSTCSPEESRRQITCSSRAEGGL